jgi:hypothetical protein
MSGAFLEAATQRHLKDNTRRKSMVWKSPFPIAMGAAVGSTVDKYKLFLKVVIPPGLEPGTC